MLTRAKHKRGEGKLESYNPKLVQGASLEEKRWIHQGK
jgi:hypothetical protein